MAAAPLSAVTGYSGTPLPKKLGLAPGMRVCAIGFDGYEELVGARALDLAMQAKPDASTDLAHLFATRRRELETWLPKLRRALRPDAVLWVSWPKKAAKVETNIVEDAIREVAKFRLWDLIAFNVRTNHAHIVMGASAPPDKMLGDLKAIATRRLREHNVWEFDHSPWVDKGSRRYLWTEEHVGAAVDYVVNGQGGPLPDFDR